MSDFTQHDLTKYNDKDVTVTLRYSGRLKRDAFGGVNGQYQLTLKSATGSFEGSRIIRPEHVVDLVPADPENWPPQRGDVWKHKLWGTLYIAGRGVNSWTLFPNAVTASAITQAMIESEYDSNEPSDFELVTRVASP